MLSVFPNLLDYALLAPFLLRLGLGALFIIHGLHLVKRKAADTSWANFWRSRKIQENKIGKVITGFGIAQSVVGVALVFGFLTQVAAIFTILFTLIQWQHDNESGVHVDTIRKSSHVFAIIISISLLFLGAGFLAIDLPL